MITRGKESTPMGEDAQKRNIRKRRVSYVTTGTPTIEQKNLIEKIERGVVEGKWDGDPYTTMRNAEHQGIDFFEEEQRADGRWYLMPTDDANMALMQTGAL
jgi:hypothetical protein